MMKLKPQTRYEPRVEATIGELITDPVFQPFTPRGPRPDMSKLFLWTMGTLNDPKGGSFYVTPTPELLSVISENSIFAVNAQTIGEEHSLELMRMCTDELKLLLRFSQISGSYCIAKVEQADVDALLADYATV
jgi:hypothetical protein